MDGEEKLKQIKQRYRLLKYIVNLLLPES